MPEDDPNLMTIFTVLALNSSPTRRREPPTSTAPVVATDTLPAHRVEALLGYLDDAGGTTRGRRRHGDVRCDGTADTLDMPTGPNGNASAIGTGDWGTQDRRRQLHARGRPGIRRPGGSVAGQVIAGRYTLLDVLGEGGMGTVYRPSKPSRSSGRWC